MVLSWRFFRHHGNQRTNPHTRQLGPLSRTLMHGFMDVLWQKERELWHTRWIIGSQKSGATAACSVFGSRSVLCNNEMRMSGVVCV